MPKKLQYVEIGKVHSAQGIRGEIFVSIYAEEAAWSDQWKTLFVSGKSGNEPEQEFTIQKIREHSKQGRWGFAVTLEQIKDRNQAEELKGFKVYVPESFLISEEGEKIYLREILGFRVIDQERGDVGVIVGFTGHDFQDILVIEGEKGPFEVPFVEPLLLEIDKAQKQIRMDIPMGLVAGEEL